MEHARQQRNVSFAFWETWLQRTRHWFTYLLIIVSLWSFVYHWEQLFVCHVCDYSIYKQQQPKKWVLLILNVIMFTDVRRLEREAWVTIFLFLFSVYFCIFLYIFLAFNHFLLFISLYFLYLYYIYLFVYWRTAVCKRSLGYYFFHFCFRCIFVFLSFIHFYYIFLCNFCILYLYCFLITDPKCIFCNCIYHLCFRDSSKWSLICSHWEAPLWNLLALAAHKGRETKAVISFQFVSLRCCCFFVLLLFLLGWLVWFGWFGLVWFVFCLFVWICWLWFVVWFICLFGFVGWFGLFLFFVCLFVFVLFVFVRLVGCLAFCFVCLFILVCFVGLFVLFGCFVCLVGFICLFCFVCWFMFVLLVCFSLVLHKFRSILDSFLHAGDVWVPRHVLSQIHVHLCWWIHTYTLLGTYTHS